MSHIIAIGLGITGWEIPVPHPIKKSLIVLFFVINFVFLDLGSTSAHAVWFQGSLPIIHQPARVVFCCSNAY